MQIDYPITFLYYTDLDPVVPFYRDVLGLDLSIDQGWAKIFRVNEKACVGLVDESRGSMTAAEEKGVLLTLVVDDVDSWYRHMRENGAAIITPPTTHEEIGVYCFFVEDPGGYRIEIQKFLN
ncbi:MAG: VOC family protein [Bacillota bacterium]